MHHTFCHFDEDYRIFAMAHRYRDKSVTQLLYKPTRPLERSNDAVVRAASSAASEASVRILAVTLARPLRTDCAVA